MLGTLTPLGERSRNAGWTVTAVIYIAASATSGAVLGAVLGLLGSLVGDIVGDAPAIFAGAVAVSAALAVGADAGFWSFRLPHFRRQVDDLWLGRFRRWVYAAGFGAQLGLGFATHVVSAATYVAFIAAFASSGVVTGGLIGLTYGVTRGSLLLLVRKVRSGQDLARVHKGLELHERALRKNILRGIEAATGAGAVALAATAIFYS